MLKYILHVMFLSKESDPGWLYLYCSLRLYLTPPKNLFFPIWPVYQLKPSCLLKYSVNSIFLPVCLAPCLVYSFQKQIVCESSVTHIFTHKFPYPIHINVYISQVMITFPRIRQSKWQVFLKILTWSHFYFKR